MSKYTLTEAEEYIRELENRIEDLLLDLDDLRCENRQLVAERDRLESMLDM